MLGMRLDRKDEYNHPLGPEPNFNESVYWNGWDPDQAAGGWMRIGNRANEGYAEMSLCLHLPNGKVAFMYKRPRISTNEFFSAGDLTYEVLEPFQSFRTKYSGEVLLLSDPKMLLDPSKAFKENSLVPCELNWELRGVSPMHGGEPTDPSIEPLYGRDFSRGHFNQHTTVSGHMHIGEDRINLRAFGWRDHSWGPRYWQNNLWHRLLVANFDAKAGMMVIKVRHKDGRIRRVGCFWKDGAYHEVKDLDVVTEWTDDKMQKLTHLTIRTDAGVEELTGEPISLVPLRNRRKIDDVIVETRITEAMTRWSWNNQSCLGFSEYLDLIQDGELLGYPS